MVGFGVRRDVDGGPCCRIPAAGPPRCYSSLSVGCGVSAAAGARRASVLSGRPTSILCRGIPDGKWSRKMDRRTKLTLALLGLGVMTLGGCDELVPRDIRSLFVPRLLRSEIIGFLA